MTDDEAATNEEPDAVEASTEATSEAGEADAATGAPLDLPVWSDDEIIWSIVIPCYKSGAWMPELVERIERAMAPLEEPFELWLVNDASPDGGITTAAIAAEAAARPWVHGVDLQFNVGQSRTTRCGYAQVNGQWILNMSDDLQEPPEELPTLCAAARAEPEMDAIYGAPAAKKHAFYRNIGSRLVHALFSWGYRKPKGLRITSHSVMSRSLVDTLVEHGSVVETIGPLVLSTTTRIKNIEVEHHDRTYGRSGYRLSRLIDHTLDILVGSTTRPLRSVSVLGLMTSAAAAVLGVVFFGMWLTDRIQEPGFTTIVLLVTFFGGTLLASIGLLAEYLSRVVTEVAQTPLYVVRERFD